MADQDDQVPGGRDPQTGQSDGGSDSPSVSRQDGDLAEDFQRDQQAHQDRGQSEAERESE
jgi:hypothetical protein